MAALLETSRCEDDSDDTENGYLNFPSPDPNKIDETKDMECN